MENMEITFLIGNGFDLRIGMKTRFADMYDGYIAQVPKSDAIHKFMEMLKTDAPKYKTWGDFEIAMAQNAKNFEDEASFIECLRDFKLYMVSHLAREEQQFMDRLSVSQNAKLYCYNDVKSSIYGFYAGLSPNAINEFIRLGVKTHPIYNFISFNYTTIFDKLIHHFQSEAIHIHGKIGADIVLGVDNIGQVVDLPYNPSKKFNRAFIKPEFNKSYDNTRLTNTVNIIDASNIICVYGMSLGASDLFWKKKLKDWLLAHKNHHLVYFVYDERKFNKANWDSIIDEEEDRIATLLGRICDSPDEMDRVFNQVHIPVGYDLFNIERILDREARESLKTPQTVVHA